MPNQFCFSFRGLNFLFLAAFALVTAGAFAQEEITTLPPKKGATAEKADSGNKTKSSKKKKAKAEAQAAEEAPKIVVDEQPDTTPAEPAPAKDQMLKFSTETGTDLKEIREPMKFKAPGVDTGQTLAGPSAPKMEIAEDAPFKAYLGYPKQNATVLVDFANFAAKWSNGTQDINFTSPTLGYGVQYKFQANPMFSMDITWVHYSVTAQATTIGSSYIVYESTKSFDPILVSTEYCLISALTFYQQFCPGLVIGKDAYPILEYSGDTSHLAMSKVEDVVVGPRIGYQTPIRESMLFRMNLGYNFGTGVGNSGALTSKSNSTLYLDAGANWAFMQNQSLALGFDYRIRTANLAGRVGSNDFTWTTKSSIIGGRLAYTYSF